MDMDDDRMEESIVLDYNEDEECKEDALLADVPECEQSGGIFSPPNSPDSSMEDGELPSDGCGSPSTAASLATAAASLLRRKSERSRNDNGSLNEDSADIIAVRRRIFASLGIACPSDDDEQSGGRLVWRREALHVHGVSQLSTNDILDYFSQVKRPSLVEWVDDRSCNVIWSDDRWPLKALDALSSPINSSRDAPTPGSLGRTNLSSSDANMDDTSMQSLTDSNNESTTAAVDATVHEESVDLSDLKFNIPPGRWRLGVPHPNAQFVLMRYANRADKPLPITKKCGAFLKVYGDPCVKGVSGIITTHRQKLSHSLPNSNRSTGEVKNPWADIAATWATAEAVCRPSVRDYDHDVELALLKGGGGGWRTQDGAQNTTDLRQKLSHRATHSAEFSRKHSIGEVSDSNSDDSDRQRNSRSRLKRPRMRMRADDVRVSAINGDLRSRLTSSRAPLRRPDDSAAGPPSSSSDEEDSGAADTSIKKPLNIKITRDFSDIDDDDDEDDVEHPESDASSMSTSVSASNEGPEHVDQLINNGDSVIDQDDDDGLLDKRTDKTSSSDLRTLLLRKRAARQTAESVA